MSMTKAEILDQLIEREIFTPCDEFVDHLRRDESGRWIDDLLPALDGPDYSEPPEGFTVKQDKELSETGHDSWGYVGPEGQGLDYLYTSEREAIEAAWNDSGEEPERIEALQFFIVSDWLADHLESVGALVARDVLGFNIWGRSEYGQSLTLDADLNRIAYNLAAL